MDYTHLHIHQDDVKARRSLLVDSCTVLAVHGMCYFVAGSLQSLPHDLHVDGVILSNQDLQMLRIARAACPTRSACSTTSDAF